VTSQKAIQLKIPLRDFIPIGIDNKCILSYPVKTAEGKIYRDRYISGIWHLQQVQEAYPSYKLFIPSSVDINHLFKKLPIEKLFYAGTGTLVLRPNKDGYADKRIRDKDGNRIKLSCTSIAVHGESWRAVDRNTMQITDTGKLKRYSEIDVFKNMGWKYIRGFDENDRGVPTYFGEKPSANYNNAKAWVNPSLLISPMTRGYWTDYPRERIFHSVFDWYSEDSHWRFPLGSEAPADRSVTFYTKLVPPALPKK